MTDFALKHGVSVQDRGPNDTTKLISRSGLLSHQYLLLFRFIAINFTGFAFLVAIWLQGWLEPLILEDHTRLIAITTVLFIIGFALCTRKIFQISLELNSLALEQPTRGSRVEVFLERARLLDGTGRQNLSASLRLKLGTKISSIKHIANSLVLLGLIGTVLGFIIALSGVEPDSVGDVAAIGPMVSTLIEGMSVALYTTLVGSVLNIWLMMNYRILEGGTVHVLTQLMDRSEAGHAGS